MDNTKLTITVAAFALAAGASAVDNPTNGSAAVVRGPEAILETLSYTGSVDRTAPLVVDVALVPDGKPKPLLIAMHGYTCSRADVRPDIQAWAKQGIVAAAPDMRGQGNSSGRLDSGGLEIHDILDAVLAVVARYPNEIDARNLNIVGYSGGGGNAILCAVRFPDLFQTCVSYFGISDYGAWHATNVRPDCNAIMEKACGGSPSNVPAMYEARNANAAAGNVLSRIHFFWDVDEGSCPPKINEIFVENYRRTGGDRVVVHASRRGDARRWSHSYRSLNADLIASDALFLPDVTAPKAVSPALPARGKLTVIGYLVTRRFSVWIGDGQQGQAVIDYDLTGPEPVVKVVDNPRGLDVRVSLSSPLSALP